MCPTFSFLQCRTPTIYRYIRPTFLMQFPKDLLRRRGRGRERRETREGKTENTLVPRGKGKGGGGESPNSITAKKKANFSLYSFPFGRKIEYYSTTDGRHCRPHYEREEGFFLSKEIEINLQSSPLLLQEESPSSIFPRTFEIVPLFFSSAGRSQKSSHGRRKKPSLFQPRFYKYADGIDAFPPIFLPGLLLFDRWSA